MAKRDKSQPPVRRSLLVIGAAVLALAVVGFALMMFAGGGSNDLPANPSNDGMQAAPSTSGAEAPHPELKNGGRNPFFPLVRASEAGAQPNAPPPASAPAASHALVEVVSVDGTIATVRVDSTLHEKVSAGTQLSGGFTLEALQGECAFLAQGPERFRVCEGERFLR